jgi:putative NIF3 family GTP cyclohydrolase 1 type 2
MRIRDVAAIVEGYAPLSTGVAGDELGLLVGDPECEVKGVVTCWSPTLSVLETAANSGANLVIGHEPLVWQVCGRDPEAGLRWYEERAPTAKVPNQKRLEYAFRKGLTVYRYHSNWDWAPRYGQVDMLARFLDLGEPQGGHRFAPVYRVPDTTVAALAARARQVLGLGPVRVVGVPDRSVTRVAICQGGFGQMFTFPELALEGGAEVALFGEMLDYTIRYCVEVGLAAVELGHCQSENPGMIGMVEFLRQRLPASIPVCNVHSGEPWRYCAG